VLRINLNAGWEWDRVAGQHYATYGAGVDWRTPDNVWTSRCPKAIRLRTNWHLITGGKRNQRLVLSRDQALFGFYAF
jgi:hypothetical protein